MSGFDRRRFLTATASAAALSSMYGSTVARERDESETADTDETGWEYTGEGATNTSFENSLRIDDGYLLVGGGEVPDEFETQGIATRLTVDGEEQWDRTYQSTPQQEAREIEPPTGPVPEDWVTVPLETADGYLLVGWTYFDGPAVYVTRIYDVDDGGAVRREESLGELEDASAYSYLTDGVETDDGFLCCGAESPGIMLGSAGWFVSLEADGSVGEQTRYPATDRDIETTSRSDVFRAVTPSSNGYVVAGSYEPAASEPPRGWVVGIDDELGERWDDRFALEEDEPTIAYDVVRSDVGNYDFVVVGVSGAFDRLGRSAITDPAVEGDGFVAAYTDDGEQQWLETLENQPLFCAERTPTGVVAGGARNGNGWIGTIDRTDFEADRPSLVTSLSRAHGGGLVAAGRQIDGERTTAWARTISASDGNGPPKESPTDETVEYLDCQRVRIVGDYTDIILGITFDPGDGQVGTITEPIGGVDGERTIDAVEEFGLDPDNTVLEYVELFADEETALPGLGDEQVTNPNLETCLDELLGHLDLEFRD